jgi:hypothetical protein
MDTTTIEIGKDLAKYLRAIKASNGEKSLDSTLRRRLLGENKE